MNFIILDNKGLGPEASLYKPIIKNQPLFSYGRKEQNKISFIFQDALKCFSK